MWLKHRLAHPEFEETGALRLQLGKALVSSGANHSLTKRAPKPKVSSAQMRVSRTGLLTQHVG
ncbi:hypothetical protein GCM10027048_04610 [Hymenobacter coalescens]